MGNIKININGVMVGSQQASNAAGISKNVENQVDALRFQIDYRILERRSIGGRLQSVHRELGEVSGKISHTLATAEYGANLYYTTERRVIESQDVLHQQAQALLHKQKKKK